jgi:DNA-binding transcriptional MerR regulator
MRVAELSTRSGVPVPTIKYYLREGLLHSGQRHQPNQAEYDEQHLRRLALIRALGDVGGLSIAAIGEVLAAMDAPDKSMHQMLGAVQEGITSTKTVVDGEARARAAKLVDELIERRGWLSDQEGPVYDQVVGVLARMNAFGLLEDGERLAVYADAVQRIAEFDVRMVGGQDGVDAIAERVVAGTVLGEALLNALRRMAHQDVSARLFGGAETG